MKKNEVNQKNGVNVNIKNININFLEIPQKRSLWDWISKMIKNILKKKINS